MTAAKRLGWLNVLDIVNPDGLRYVLRLSVGRCRLTVSNPVLKARLVSALETKMWSTALNDASILLSISTCGATSRTPKNARCCGSCAF